MISLMLQKYKTSEPHRIDNLLKMNADGAAGQVPVLFRVVNERCNLLAADFRRAIAKHEQQRIDNVTLPASIGSDNR